MMARELVDSSMNGTFDSRYTEYQTTRSPLRKWVRRAYLASARSKLHGATLDFGCGIGELLTTLPAGSMGLEYNEATVAYCLEHGLDVHWYDGMQDGWKLSIINDGRRFESMVISHVLEHLDAPMDVLRSLLVAANRLGMLRVLVIVPGRSGYRKDPTHKTFVDLRMLRDFSVTEGTGFSVLASGYFPGNSRVVGDCFPYHELQVVYARDRSDDRGIAEIRSRR